MNLRQYSIALLISALPMLSIGHPSIEFNEGDFKGGQKVERNGQTLLSLKLSKSGKAKIKKLNKIIQEKKIHTNLAGVKTNFQVKVPITGEGLEMGPYSKTEASKILEQLNE